MDSCSNYIASSPYLMSFTVLRTWNISVSFGYNRVMFTAPRRVSKGSMIYIDASSTASLILDPTFKNILYSDYVVSGSQLIPLDLVNNRRFHYSCLISDEYYLSTYQFSHKYDNTGQYRLKSSFIESTFNITRLINITRSMIHLAYD